jgi:hypothetical protein
MLAVIDHVTPAAAQITAATVSGIVRDATGGVLPGVELTVTNLDTGFARVAATRDDGTYTISGLPPGPYQATAHLQTFGAVIQAAIHLAVAQQATLNLTMKVSASEFVVVIATPASVDTKTSALSGVVDARTIETLPLNGRNFIDLALLQPGVVAFSARQRTGPTGRGQQLNINGANGRANSYLLDGANMNGYAGVAVATAADTTLGVDLIREFRIVTNAFAADYGRAMGGVVSVVSKAGTNEFHGSGFEFFRNEALDARNYFDVDKPAFERHQFGVTFGGPIRTNRTFFFVGGERVVEDLGLTQVTEVPSVSARSGALGPIASAVQPYLDLFPLPNGADLGDGLARFSFPFERRTRETFVQARVDHTISSSSALFARYTSDRGTRGLPTLLPQFSSDQQSRSRWFTVEEKHSVRTRLFNTARFSYSRVDLSADLTDASAAATPSFVPGEPLMGNLLIGSREYGHDRQNPQHQDVAYFTFSDDVLYSRHRHLLKAGVLVERALTDTENSTNVRGRFTFPNVQRFLEGTPTRFTGVLPGYTLDRSRRNTTVGLYIQDDLTAHERLTLNVGLRYEFYTVPNDTAGRDSALRDVVTDRDFTPGVVFVNPSLKNVGPRAGLAWDVFGNGRTAIRAGAGVYYDTDGPFNSALLAAAFSPPSAYSVSITNPTFPRPPLERATLDRSARAIDYHVKQPRMLTWNVNLQREVLRDLVLTTAYAGSRGYNLVQAIEGNPVLPEVRADGTVFFPVDAPRRNLNWESIDFRSTGGRSWYKAVQIDATKRFAAGHRWQVSYTSASAVDETQGQVGGDATNTSVFPQNPLDPRQDRGPADFDVRHALAVNATWALPVAQASSGVAAVLATGWQVSVLAMIRSGVPFSPSIQTQNNWSRSGNVAPGAENRPNVRSGIRSEDIVRGGATQYFNPDAFVLQPRGFLGTTPRNMLRGPGLATVNMSLVKTSTRQLFGSDGQIELRIEAFNVFNRTNFGLPNRVVFGGASEGEAPLPTAGQITTTATDARQVQLGVKMKF